MHLYFDGLMKFLPRVFTGRQITSKFKIIDLVKFYLE